MLYFRAQRILMLARDSRGFHMLNIYIARQALHLVILLNDLAYAEDGLDGQQMDEREVLADELVELETAMRDWSTIEGFQETHSERSLTIKTYYHRFFRKRFYFESSRDPEKDTIYQRLLVYDTRGANAFDDILKGTRNLTWDAPILQMVGQLDTGASADPDVDLEANNLYLRAQHTDSPQEQEITHLAAEGSELSRPLREGAVTPPTGDFVALGFDHRNEMEQATQETRIASQGYLQLQEEEANHNAFWGLLYPIAHKGNRQASPWRFNKDKRTYTVGRSASADVKITGQIISNIHCNIHWDGLTGARAGIHLVDSSRNGTWVKGQRVAKGHATALHEGDEVAFGVPNASQNGESHRYTFRIPAETVELKGIHVNYIMEQELGKSSFATVVKALHRPTGQYFAVKVIPRPKSLLQPNTVKMLEREMAILRQLDHPNIVQLCDVVPSDTELCLVMELVTGGDLFDYILSAGYLMEDRAGPLTAELCDAMAYIHFKGITHRDLKPENILLTSNTPPILKVADFGLAKCVDSQTMLRTMCGTPSYLAPEVVLQDSRHSGYDQKVDSWSVGAIVFAMLTGHSAFRDEEDQPLPKRMKERTVAWEHMTEYECSPDASSFVDQLLQFDPAMRMSQSDALRHPWLFPAYCKTGLPTFFLQLQAVGVIDQASPGSFAGSVMSAPAGTPLNGISDEFQQLELETDSMSESPAFIDFDDASVGGSSDLAGSQQLRSRLKEHEQSWDLLEESGDLEQTPLARPRNLPLEMEEEQQTVRMRPAVITDLSAVPPPTGGKKRKMSSSEDMDTSSTPHPDHGRTRMGARKVSKVSQFDTPTTATRSKAPNGGALPGNRKASLRGAGKGKPPIAHDFADVDE